jgi:drug/metabolite transporter (DMT)-like permease
VRRDEKRPLASAYLQLVAASVLWSTGGLLIRWVDWHPLGIACLRSAIASVVFLLYIRNPRFTWSYSQIGAALCYSVMVFLFVSSVKLTRVANAIMLQYTAPIYTAIFGGAFLGERTRWGDWVSVAAVLGGIFLFFFDDLSMGQYLGNTLALAAGVALAWMGMFLRKQKDDSPFESILLGNLVTAAVGVPFTLRPLPSLNGWIGLLLLGVFQLGFSYLFFASAVKRVKALDTILICTIEPILNPVWVFLLMGEKPGTWAFVGGGVIIVSLTARAVFDSTAAPV